MRLRLLLDAADLAAYRWAHRDVPGLDPVARVVTRSADFSALWLVTSGVLALTQGRAGRRAAARGLLSIALSSAVVNGPLKSAVRRPRPIAGTRNLHRRTKTTSFPSGHSASAAAFAVGAASELSRLRVPLGVAAGLVGGSRVRAGAHYPGDVLGGWVVGAGVALLTRRFWPVPPPESERGQRATPDPRHQRREGQGVVVVVNSAAGVTEGGPQGLAELLPRAVVVEAPEGGLDDALARAAGSAEVLGICGGDGSVNAAAAVALEKDLPLLVVPGGTLNHFARDIGIETLDDVALALHQGSVADVDVALMGDEVFLNTASIGWYADLVELRERLEERIGKWPAVLVAVVRVLRARPPLEVALDGERHRVWMVFFGNCRYRPSGFAPSWRERLDDGLVDVRVVRADSPGARARLLLALLTGTLGRSPAYEHRTSREVRVTSPERPLRVARDGEVSDGRGELVVRKADRRLRVYVKPG